jgi:hypothetical protein
MALTAYSFEARNLDGTLATGLTPVIGTLKKESDNTNLTGVTITFLETTPGFYKFYFDPIVNGEAFIQIDLGSIMSSSLRYINMHLTVDSTPNLLASLVDTGLTLRQALKASAAVLFGNATVSGGSITYRAQDGTTTAITGGTFDGNGGRTITKGNLN